MADQDATSAAACRDLEDVRAEIDRIDKALALLLAERQTFVEAAGRMKPRDKPMRDPARVEAIIARLRADAPGLGLDPDFAEAVWRALLEAAAALQERLRDAAKGANTRADAP